MRGVFRDYKDVEICYMAGKSAENEPINDIAGNHNPEKNAKNYQRSPSCLS
jgi:hypothetical protein